MRKTLIQHKEVSAGGSASIEFTNIPQTYTDLLLVYSVRSADGGNQNDSGQILFNGDSNTANYSTRQLRGTGSATESGIRTTTPGEINGSSSTSNTFSSGKAYISNYTSTENKSVYVDVVSENNATSAFQHASSMLYSTSSAITQIAVKSEGSLNLAQYSSASLYGISRYNVAGGSPKASGGIISYDSANDKWVHVFAASGTFTPSENLTAEYLVIAGGGGGATGGGGAGGYRCSVSGESSGGGASAESALTLTTGTNYTVTVGAGGAGINTASNDGQSSSGSNSVFGTITSTAGGGGGGYSATAALRDGLSGGSGGGGGARSLSSPTGSGTGGTETANQGYAGGNGDGTTSSGAPSGGGGGAGATGGNASAPDTPGNGGVGVASSITGSSIYRAGGGGGADNVNAGSGGNGGGGTAAISGTATSGSANTGGGGGGNFNGTSGNGGSGVVIVRYSA